MFKTVKSVSVPEYNGIATLYRDDRSNMEVFHVKNDSKELSCAFIFGTPSEDSKGTAHILEHTVLCGSEHYPVKDPFSQIYLSSPNTFLNAITFCDKTMYPFASPLKKDFDNIFDVYADAVFAPLLRKESFQQEGVRAFEDKFDGVVFNEMTGALSTEDSAVESYCARKLFEGTPCEYESGGEPYYIADLTYEEYLARYRKWYSPSNCRVFLFGDLDASEYMEKISSRYLRDLSRWENKTIVVESSPYINEFFTPARDTAYTQAQDSNSIVLTWLTCPSDDVDNTFTASLLVDILLGSPSAPLYRAITESGLGEDLSQVSGINTEYPVVTFTAGLVNAKPDSEDRIEKFLLDALSSYANDGLDKTAVASAMKRQEFKVQEITGDSFPFGLGVCLKAARTWMRGSSPFDGILELDKLNRLKKKMEDPRYLEKWIDTYLVKNKRRCLLTVRTDASYANKIETALAVKFEGLHKDSSTDWDKEKENFYRFLSMEDRREELDKIPRITIEDIPPYSPAFKTETIRTSPYRLYNLVQTTRGIVYFHMAFSCLGLTLEEKKLFPLLMRVLQMCGTKTTDWVSFGNRIKYLTGSFSMTFSAGKGYGKNSTSNLLVRTKMLREDSRDALDIIKELLLTPDFTSDRIKAAQTDIITDFESSFIDSGSSYASLYSSSFYSASALENELTLGVSSYLYIRDLRKNSEIKELSVRLENLRKKLITQRGLSIHVSSEETDIKQMTLLAEDFAASLPMGEAVEPSEFYTDFAAMDRNVALIVSGAPAYNAMAIPMGEITNNDVADLVVLGSSLGSGCLWNSVRGRFGAYGVECHIDSQEKLFLFSSYRDPMIDNTYNEFLKSLEHRLSQEERSFAVITVIGRELKPYAPWGKSSESFRRKLYNVTDELYLAKRERILSADCDSIFEASSKVLEKARLSKSKVTVCGVEMKDKLDQSFETVKLPL